MKKFLFAFVLVSSLSLLPLQLQSQEIVHALCGTVSSINTASHTITLFQDTGSPATFNVSSSSSTRVAFDKKVADEVTAAKEFQKQGAYVILFYYGIQENRTAVALKSLGTGPFSSTTGEVTEWNKHSQTVSIRGNDGSIHSFKLSPQTVGETYQGVVDGSRFEVSKGEQVRLVSSTSGGTQTVLFIRER
ncbi:MAG: hypothetical protein JST28_13495 [Acidobacteria bacterium]|nr:hypothetical protein [Acidobacteriota bacterium]